MLAFKQGLDCKQVLRLLSGDWTKGDYKQYLHTNHWEQTKNATLEFMGASCCLCDSTNGLQVHHRPGGYHNLFNEKPIKHLVVLCTRCHRMDNQGGTVGPDLTGVGGRFSRIHLVESILQPSLHIANGYGMVVVILQNDDAVAGVKREETPKTLTLWLLDGKLLTLQKSRIKQVTPTPLSLMPAGMEKLWTRQEFVDLIEYLAGQKKP